MALYLSEILNFISRVVSHPSGMGLLGIILGHLLTSGFVGVSVLRIWQ